MQVLSVILFIRSISTVSQSARDFQLFALLFLVISGNQRISFNNIPLIAKFSLPSISKFAESCIKLQNCRFLYLDKNFCFCSLSQEANKIRSLKGLDTLKNLERLLLSENLLESLECSEDVPKHLEYIDLRLANHKCFAHS